jgi:hypothetical protein
MKGLRSALDPFLPFHAQLRGRVVNRGRTSSFNDLHPLASLSQLPDGLVQQEKVRRTDFPA